MNNRLATIGANLAAVGILLMVPLLVWIAYGAVREVFFGDSPSVPLWIGQIAVCGVMALGVGLPAFIIGEERANEKEANP